MDDAAMADRLDVLGHEHRIAILRALADADEPLSFSTLHARVGMRDSGKFNYHLERLCEYFVREVAGGYELGHAGERVVSAAGPDGTDGGVEESPDASDERCPVCGESDCGKLFHVHLTPPWA